MRISEMFWIAIYFISALVTILSYNTFIFYFCLLNICIAFFLLFPSKKNKLFNFLGRFLVLLNICLYVPASYLDCSPFGPYLDDKFRMSIETAKRDNRHVFAMMESSLVAAHKAKEAFNPSAEFWTIVASNEWLAAQHMQVYLINTNMFFWRSEIFSSNKPYVAKLISCPRTKKQYYVFITGDLTEGVSTNQLDCDLVPFCIQSKKRAL